MPSILLVITFLLRISKSALPSRRDAAGSPYIRNFVFSYRSILINIVFVVSWINLPSFRLCKKSYGIMELFQGILRPLSICRVLWSCLRRTIVLFTITASIMKFFSVLYKFREDFLRSFHFQFKIMRTFLHFTTSGTPVYSSIKCLKF